MSDQADLEKKTIEALRHYRKALATVESKEEAEASAQRALTGILADSFRHAGQTTAILVVREEHGSFRVISGIHRVVAAKELGWDQIDAVVLDCDERGLRLIEIADNLHRRELSVLERAKLVNEWLDLICQEAAQVGHPLGGRQPKDRGFSKAERTLGVSRAEATRSACIARMPLEVTAKAIELGLDNNQAALLEVAKLPTTDLQVMQLHEISERKKLPRRPVSKRRTHGALQDEGSGSPSSASAASFQLLPPEQDWSLPENLDRRNVAEHLGLLKLKWSDFRPFSRCADSGAQAVYSRDPDA